MYNALREIAAANGIDEPFIKLASNGVANEIYATSRFILRIPTDHPEAISDAFTEAVAAPLAKLNGIKTPELIRFDDSYKILKKTYSIWERVHGLTLGEIEGYIRFSNTWQEIGFELGKLHVNVKSCEDPKGWLDNPDRDYTIGMITEALRHYGNDASYFAKLIEDRFADGIISFKKCFIHGDTNEFNFICNENDGLLSVIDWGDAGWGDPAVDFYMIPIDALGFVLDGYKQCAGTNVDVNLIYRIILDKIWTTIQEEQDISALRTVMELENSLLRKL